MLYGTERSYDISSEHIRSSIYALWEQGHELLEDAAFELMVDLELFEADLDSDPSRRHLLADAVSVLRAWLKAQNYPDWEPCPESVLDDLTEQEIYLAFAKWQLDLSGMKTPAGSTAAEKVEHRNVALTVSERALAHAERLAFAVKSRLH